MSKNERKCPKGYWIGVGIAIGAALGPFFETIGIGIAIGIATRRITNDQTITVDGGTGTVLLN